MGEDKRVVLSDYFHDTYNGSNYQKSMRTNPIPHKVKTSRGEYYYYNADLSGLMSLTDEDNKLKYFEFTKAYENGFNKGLLHLSEEEEITLRDLKNVNLREGTINHLKYILYEKEFKKRCKGILKLVFDKVPLVWTIESIRTVGYNNGIIHSINDLCGNIGLSVDDLKKNNKPKLEESPDSCKRMHWFKVGLLFAKGDMDKYRRENNTIIEGYTFPKIAEEVGLDKFSRPYINATFNNYNKSNSNSDKNVYNDRDKMLSIIEHCKSEGIEVTSDFIKSLPPETT